jgi:6-pyruvoyltetrahydropterin/6-carboxytetrahydropterin synthase
MYQINKQLRSFSAAHRVTSGYQGKCRDLHGHNYDLNLTFRSSTLDQYGFVIDFDDITRFFDQWVQDHWDHCTLVSSDDAVLLDFVKTHQQKYYVFPEGKTTTVENMARHLFVRIEGIMHQHPDVFGSDLTLAKLTLWETKSSSATICA